MHKCFFSFLRFFVYLFVCCFLCTLNDNAAFGKVLKGRGVGWFGAPRHLGYRMMGFQQARQQRTVQAAAAAAAALLQWQGAG